ncbi:hypothetical protein [Novosphingobium guangzhouense]|uniref:Uncharacterized protein n=1 Tax=Novosphingobium guangzhouense TaxID=1850347 RepID=A0A2K2FZV5_9SPHN|nr:hypothetical protein [Novosphingobium guangzhouense]PNU04292.1 hypothetical protein A8V01_21220 [Novosphingobium guangzhouense]
MIQISQLMREGRDAVIAEKFRDGRPATNPYGPHSKRRVFWQRGADEARSRADAVLQIGA